MLIITGAVAYDYIMDFPGKFSDHILAGKEHSINISFTASKFARRRGGTGGNASYGLGILATPHILFTVAGRDFAEYKRAFQKFGIETKHILIDKKAYTATGFAMTDERDNQIWGFFYGASDRIKELDLRKVGKKGDLVLLGPGTAAGSMTFVKQCIEMGLSYMFDPGFLLTEINNEELRTGIEHAAFIVGNDYEMSVLRSRIKNFRNLVKDKIVITTFGRKGALIERKSDKYHITPVIVKNVVDPTGAGDAWRAGFLAGLSRNYDLQTCGQMGSVSAAYAVEHYGTQEHKFTKSQFTKRYKDAYNTEIVI